MMREVLGDTGNARHDVAMGPAPVLARLLACQVAAKPEGAKPQAEAKTHEQNAIVKEEHSVYGPPGSGPQEEEVQQATGEMPQGKIPGSYPETNSGTYRDFVPPPGRSAPAPTAPSQRAAPASYQPGPPNNVPPTRTSGPRYERTGSGLY